MNKLIKKAFTLVELLVVIAILAVLGGIGIVGYNSFIDKANKQADDTLLSQLNSLLIANGLLENKSYRNAIKILEENNISFDDISFKQKDLRLGYDISSNRFILENNDYYNVEYSDDYDTYSSFRNLFDVTINNNIVYGFKTFTDYTTFTYKYIDSSNNVIVGDTVTEKNTLTYWLHIPYDYKPYISYPVITYIHGSGGDLFLQGGTCDACNQQLTAEQYLPMNKSFNESLLSPDVSNKTLFTSYRDNFTGIDIGSAFGNTWDGNNFPTQWFNHIKDHPEDDAIFVFVQMHDEMWWENLGSYTYNGQSGLKMMCLKNMYEAGFGETKGTASYKHSYRVSELGPNVYFQLLQKLYDKLETEYNIDFNRYYIIGASLGGVSTLDLISHYPDRYASAISCAAASSDDSNENTSRLTDINILCLHGASDGLCSKELSSSFVESVNNNGGHAECILQSGAGHEATPLATHFDKVMEYLHKSK